VATEFERLSLVVRLDLNQRLFGNDPSAVFPGFGRGLLCCEVESSHGWLSEPMIRQGFFAPFKPFWTVMDPIQYLSRGESAA
jgi:hypothetical protein